MSSGLRLWLVFLAMRMVGCAPAISVHSARSPNVSFDRYRTFAFESREGAPGDYASSPRSAEVCRRVAQEAGKLLEAKGYMPAVGGQSDLVLRVGAGRRERVVEHPQPERPGWLDEDEEDDFVEGAFVIDAFDAASTKLVWHGSARAEVDPSRIDDQGLHRAVVSVLAGFPPHIPDSRR
jgi:hypothetical protein